MNINYRSQSAQDRFVCETLKYKKNGYFVEVGSQHPRRINNTYVLEHSLGWKGLMFEKNKRWKKSYSECRKNSDHIFGDATKHNYLDIFKKYNTPSIIDYLQIDINPPVQTLKVLENLNDQVMDNFQFRVVTFEHDACHPRWGSEKYRAEIMMNSREIFKSRGYIPVFRDVANKRNDLPFEDWYVREDLVDMDYINHLIDKNKDNYKPCEAISFIDKSIVAQKILF